jgi:serine protease
VHHILLFCCLLASSSATHAISWNSLDGPYGGESGVLFVDSSGSLWAGSSAGDGVYVRARGSSIWQLTPGLPAQTNISLAEGADRTIHVAGIQGVYVYPHGATSWIQVSGKNGLPDRGGSSLASDGQGNLYVGMNDDFVYRLAAGSTTWSRVGSALPHDSPIFDLQIDSAGNLWALPSGEGVYKLPSGATTWIPVNDGLDSEDRRVLGALAVVGNDVFVGVPFGGARKLPNGVGSGTTWTPWHGGALSAFDGISAFAAGPGDTLYAVGEGVVYSLDSGSQSWNKVGAVFDRSGSGYAIVYDCVTGMLSVGNRSGVFDLPSGQTTWRLVVNGMTATRIGSLAVTANGDLYAGTYGNGVQKFSRSSATWFEVDPARSEPTVGGVVIDGNGKVYAAIGGNVLALSDGQWTATPPWNSGYVESIAVDAANNVWAGGWNKVQRLNAGAVSWIDASSGLGMDNVMAMVFDSAGAAYARMFNGGLYRLPAGAPAWSVMNGGLSGMSVHAIASSASGGIHASTTKGVFKFAGGSWQPVGTGLTGFIRALAVDPATGDLYAGVDNGYGFDLDTGNTYAGSDSGVYRLAAGTSAWAPVKLGLFDSPVSVLATGGGRVYAATTSHASPSGVYVLSLNDPVVEFHNRLIDHFFITATAAEQAAIRGGAAGPGWSETGHVFSAGGASPVCRFYGSTFPGPNSHFFTIDPAECQQLKDLQASTPPTSKRWNFEGNDFLATKPTDGVCPDGTRKVYRAYNDGFAHGIDSNHRLTSSRIGYQLQVEKGWIGEGVVMCAPL